MTKIRWSSALLLVLFGCGGGGGGSDGGSPSGGNAESVFLFDDFNRDDGGIGGSWASVISNGERMPMPEIRSKQAAARDFATCSYLVARTERTVRVRGTFSFEALGDFELSFWGDTDTISENNFWYGGVRGRTPTAKQDPTAQLVIKQGRSSEVTLGSSLDLAVGVRYGLEVLFAGETITATVLSPEGAVLDRITARFPGLVLAYYGISLGRDGAGMYTFLDDVRMSESE